MAASFNRRQKKVTIAKRTAQQPYCSLNGRKINKNGYLSLFRHYVHSLRMVRVLNNWRRKWKRWKIWKIMLTGYRNFRPLLSTNVFLASEQHNRFLHTATLYSSVCYSNAASFPDFMFVACITSNVNSKFSKMVHSACGTWNDVEWWHGNIMTVHNV